MQKAKEAAQVEKEVAEASKQASYLLDTEEIEIRLAEELVKVCRDYCKVTWEEALNLVRVLANSEWRQPGSVFYYPDICEAPAAIPPPFAFAPESSEKPLTAQAAFSFPEASKGSSQAGD